MKRFLIFGGSDYYPAGGWNDFRGDFDTQDLASAEALRLALACQWDWWHVVDSATKAVSHYHSSNPSVSREGGPDVTPR